MDNQQTDSILVAWKICVDALNQKGLGQNKTYTNKLIQEFKDLKRWNIFLREDKAGELLQARVLRQCYNSNPSNSLVIWLLGLGTEPDISKPYSTKTVGKSDPPDIDLDLIPSVRTSVKKFLVEKFGENRVCSVGTVGTYKTRSVIIDTSRALGLDVKEAQEVTKNLPLSIEEDEEEHSIEKMSFEDIMRNEDTLGVYMQNHEDVLHHSMTLRGQCRQYGTHAGGMIVADRDIDGEIPVFRDKDGNVVSCWSESGSITELSSVGYIKMDLLGLSHLKIVDDCIQMIKQNRGITVNRKDIPVNSHEAIRIGTKGDMTGIFQMESPYTKKIADKMGVDSLDNISALTSLIRPGPKDVGLDVEYAERKNGKLWDRIPVVSDVLKETMGILVYQESIPKLAMQVAGFDPIDGNALRKSCSKKNLALIEKYRQKFIDGARKKVVDTRLMTIEQVENLYSTIESMAGYAFNKCLWCNTKIETMEGMLPIALVHVGDMVTSPDGDGWVKVLSVISNGQRKCYLYRGKDGQEICCTPDHKFKVNGIGMVTVAECVKNQYMVKMEKGSCFLSEVKGSECYVETYDLEVDHPNHCFYANGFAVSNSHAYSYSALTAQEIWLRYNYFPEYICSLIRNTDASAVKRGEKVFDGYIKYAASKGVPILLPDVNKSSCGMTVEKGSIRFGLDAVRNVSSIAEVIPSFQPFTSMKDFSDRVKSTNEDGKVRKVNVRVIESLMYGGAFDSLHGGRTGAYNEFTKLKGGQQSLFEEENVLPNFQEKQEEMLGCKIPEDLYSIHSVVVKDYGCVSFPYVRTSEKEVRLCIFGRLTSIKETVTKTSQKKCLLANVSSGMDDYIVRVFERDIDQFKNRYEKGDISIFPLKNMGADCDDKLFRFFDNKPDIIWKIRGGEVIHG
jgi:DNA polymerase III alpha subunit